MATNPYFNHVTSNFEERDLYHSLMTEMVQLAGIDVYYIESENLGSADWNQVLGENRNEVLKKSTLIEMYPENAQTMFDGQDLYAKFGIAMSHQFKFVCGVQRFDEALGHRPREGDYIYIPAWSHLAGNDMIRIQKVDTSDLNRDILGSPIQYFIHGERARFTHQEIDTGISTLDRSADLKENNNSTENVKDDDGAYIDELNELLLNFDEQHLFGKP